MNTPSVFGRSLGFGALWAVLFIPYYYLLLPWVGASASFGAYLLLGLCLYGTLQFGSSLARLAAGLGLGGLALLVGSLVTGPIPLVLGAAGVLGAMRLLVVTGNKWTGLGHLAVELGGIGGALLFANLGVGAVGVFGYVFVIWRFFLVQALVGTALRPLQPSSNRERFEAARRMALRLMESS